MKGSSVDIGRAIARFTGTDLSNAGSPDLGQLKLKAFTGS